MRWTIHVSSNAPKWAVVLIGSAVVEVPGTKTDRTGEPVQPVTGKLCQEILQRSIHKNFAVLDSGGSQSKLLFREQSVGQGEIGAGLERSHGMVWAEATRSSGHNLTRLVGVQKAPHRSVEHYLCVLRHNAVCFALPDGVPGPVSYQIDVSHEDVP